MKTIKAFQTSDGRIHQTEIAAMRREYEIEVRGAIQSSISPGRGETVLISDICEAIARNGKKFSDVIARNSRKIAGANARAQNKLAKEAITMA